jgi:hypothetical protein
MKIYLDNCSYNRPFDEQASMVVRFETDAKLQIQELIKNSAYYGDIKVVNPIDFIREYPND